MPGVGGNFFEAAAGVGAVAVAVENKLMVCDVIAASDRVVDGAERQQAAASFPTEAIVMVMVKLLLGLWVCER